MKYSLLLGALVLTASASLAQNMLGVSTSRYGGTNRLYINPAFAASSPQDVYLNGFMGNAHVNNNYVRYQAPFSLLRLISGSVQDRFKRPDGTIAFDASYTKEMLDGKPKNGTLWGEVRGPSMLIRTSPRSALAVTTRFRAVGQVIGASESVLSAVRSGLGEGAPLGIPSVDNQLSANTSTYAELGLTYAGTLLEGDGRKLMMGATAKVLLGYNAQHLINRGLDYRIITDPTNPNSAILEVTRLNADLGYTTFLQNRAISLRTLVSPSSPGRGVGLDLGFSYVSKYDSESPALQLGLALTDLGGLTYRGEQYAYSDIGETPVQFTSQDFNNLGGSVDIARLIQNKLTTGRRPDRNSFRSGLPTSLNLTVDYELPDGFGLNVTYLQDVRSVEATAIHQPTLLAVTPRYETRWVSMAVPLAYLNRGVTAGLSVRVGPAWIGSDNVLGLLGNSTNGIRPRGLDVYGGVAFGIGRSQADNE
ncbi:DUF5723 family protein [Spirosoma utsteinense]|uniref:DUF5723 domain-containing protein n=1 Tax=Spirosoma utsteinense TaxID=2585773 RepID=A0ABR6W693_9BACT|nr:DUF5723 family protein [Spirosoma utsteinense]MBC3785519.1 hypothetical protein [Spirosoma utsteinense]MBC3791668.1 hypothetical protein [Spirosoma utsteinense]